MLALARAGDGPITLRINSPGGSAMASEVMWQAVRNVAKKKPVIVSVGGMAASGGYYLACAGDTIFADPAAIVGSGLCTIFASSYVPGTLALIGSPLPDV